MSNCPVCNSDHVEEVLDVGEIALSGRYLGLSEGPESRFPRVLGCCVDCGLSHLISPVGLEEVVPRFGWLRTGEPESHVGGLARAIGELEGARCDWRIGSFSSKDETLLSMLSSQGYGRVFCGPWLRGDASGKGIEWLSTPETLLSFFSVDSWNLDVQYDVLLARHVVEHCSELRRFFDICREVVRPGGYVVLEVPCCDDHMSGYDYSMLWEEHVHYFTPVTFRGLFEHFDMELVYYQRVNYPLEDSLVGIGRIGGDSDVEKIDSQSEIACELERVQSYGLAFGANKEQVRGFLRGYTIKGNKAAMLGAGHLGCTFINMFEVGEFLEFVVDDNPHKAGLRMAGSGLSIVGSGELIDNNIGLCFLSTNPELDVKIVGNNNEFIEKGGKFVSIFPGSALYWKKHL